MNQSIVSILITAILAGACASSKKPGVPLNYDPPGSTNTKTKPIQSQSKGEITVSDVTIDNTFPGARMNGLSQINDSIYQVTIAPENQPINMSPWYSFRIRSESKKQIFINLNYTFGKHRYYPDFSENGTDWHPFDSTMYKVHETDSAVLQLNLDQKWLWVSAQELQTSENNENWIKNISNHDGVVLESYGNSRERRELKALKIGMQKKQPALIVISRQHPPEVTGYMAMKAFIEEILSDTELSNDFRSKFSILLVPMMNPDGVDNGHWRHNTGGVDLNRDWQFYNQPEIDQFQKFVHQTVKENKLDVVLGLDFHSTHHDLLYTFNEETFPSQRGVVKKWIQELRASFPDEEITEEDGGAASPVSKNWFLNEFKAEAVTYEVGDDTPRDHLKKKGEVSAQILMKLLLTKYTNEWP